MLQYCPKDRNGQEIVTVIETVHNFCDFRKALIAKSLLTKIFVGLIDNGLLGCSWVVWVYLRKWGHFGGVCSRLNVLLIGC